MSDIKMTEYSHGLGYGCKISPAVLDVMLSSQIPAMVDDALLVGIGYLTENINQNKSLNQII